MKIYTDKNNRLVGLEIVFYDKNKEERPKTDLDIGREKKAFFINNSLYDVLVEYLNRGGKLNDLIYDEKKNIFIQDKINEERFICSLETTQVVVIDLEKFRLNSDLRRHLKNVQEYELRELNEIPFEKIKEEYLYPSDKIILENEKSGRLKMLGDKRYFGLFYKDNLIAFVFLARISDFYQVLVLYYDKEINNSGYAIIYLIIEKLKSEGEELLNLGKLSRSNIGSDQFKKKWGRAEFINNVKNLKKML
jgi:hypothetical protein